MNLLKEKILLASSTKKKNQQANIYAGQVQKNYLKGTLLMEMGMQKKSLIPFMTLKGLKNCH